MEQEKKENMKILLKETCGGRFIGYIIVEHETRIFAELNADFKQLAEILIDKYYELQYLQRN